ncbi:MAG: transposase [Gammaproteobacteria bacterium]|nr:transposase [Gammaproteobacteria bacterium]
MIIIALAILVIKAIFKRNNCHFYKTKRPHEQHEHLNHFKARKKPDWVTHEVLKIKARSPNLSCRLIAHIFNKRFAHKGESVGKTFVSYTIRAHWHEIQVIRKEWKCQKPLKVRFNQYWGMDITFVNNKPVLGVIEHHSRKLLGLIPINNKSSINIIRQLILIFKSTNKPKTIRVDNEACFNSRLIRLFLKLMGIKHQPIEKYSPWQNGRIERLFGTFKSNIKRVEIKNQDLPILCYDFQNWYNTIRPHQSLNGNTPEEIYWNQVRKQYRQ